MLLVIVLNILITTSALEIDPLGYILYCPCMGRFGNQVDHFLGALGFAHGLNRTLALPPWVEYRYGEAKSIQVPFKKYFKIESLQVFHKVVAMEEFMAEVAPVEWPPDKRISFCYMSRGDAGTCNAKEGNPFGPFWDTFSVDFIDSEFYGPLHYDTYHHNMAKQWKTEYPPDLWPVLAFTGAPASFPVQKENRALHKYLTWSNEYELKADHFIKSVLPKGAFLGIHLRNGMDWVRACKHIPQSPSLFAAPQCVGYQNERGEATQDMCMPTKQTILRQLKRAIKNYKPDTIQSVFVASDSNHMLADLSEGLKRMKVSVYKYDKDDPHLDLVILGKSNYFIGNCVSSYSAFVKRERDAKGFPSGFWAFPSEKNYHDEL